MAINRTYSQSIVLAGALMLAAGLFGCSSQQVQDPMKYSNTEIEYKTTASNLWQVIKAYVATEHISAPERAVPLQSLSAGQLAESSDDVVYRLGHSTLLLRLDGKYILLDPVFSERVSPFKWFGPKRFHTPPIALHELPEIDLVVISHDHYDHLDEEAVLALAEKTQHFVVPLGVGDRMIKWGLSADKISQLEWWQETEQAGIKLAATPAQHFSGRGLFDRDQTLWASWVIAGTKHKVFFSGDSGYFSGFKQIGEKYGPFDYTFVETGAYNELWSEIHMMPEQSVQAHIDLRGKKMLPIHNGTFDLALHDWFEPLARSSKAAAEKNVELVTPIFGQPVFLAKENITQRWWENNDAL